MKLSSGWLALTLMLGSVAAQAVGFQRLSVDDPGGAALEVGVWYPSDAIAAPQRMGPITQNVAPSGAPAGRDLPLIVMSHGTGGSYLSHHDTATTLAEAGFIVAAVTHSGDNYADQSRSVMIMDRPRHITRLIDHMVSTWPEHARIDATRVGMFGFSAGGLTALLNVGGVADFTRVAPFCREHGSDFACRLLARNSGAAALSPPAAGGGVDDSRIKAAVIAAPALGFAFVPAGLAGVKLPIQLWRAENDTILPHPWYAEAVRSALPQAPEYHVVKDAGHFDFLAPCSAALAAVAADICVSAAGFDRTDFHAGFNAAVAAFFARTLQH